jgi:hypothetical protein
VRARARYHEPPSTVAPPPLPKSGVLDVIRIIASYSCSYRLKLQSALACCWSSLRSIRIDTYAIAWLVRYRGPRCCCWVCLAGMVVWSLIGADELDPARQEGHVGFGPTVRQVMGYFEFGISPRMPNFGESRINLAKNCRLQTDTLDKQPVPSIYFVVKVQVSTVQVWKQVHGHDKCKTHPNLETRDRVIISYHWL